MVEMGSSAVTGISVDARDGLIHVLRTLCLFSGCTAHKANDGCGLNRRRPYVLLA